MGKLNAALVWKRTPRRIQSHELHLAVNSNQEGYLSFIDNWDPDWEASIGGKETDIFLLFGSFKTVKLPEGKSNVLFTYSPKLRMRTFKAYPSE